MKIAKGIKREKCHLQLYCKCYVLVYPCSIDAEDEEQQASIIYALDTISAALRPVQEEYGHIPKSVIEKFVAAIRETQKSKKAEG